MFFVYLNSFGHIWIYLDSFGLIRAHLGSFRLAPRNAGPLVTWVVLLEGRSRGAGGSA
jgi:hypothetical protein